MAKKLLTDRAMKSLKPAKAGQRYDLMDTLVRGFGIRVNDEGRAVFMLNARYPGRKHPDRRTLGLYGAATDKAARVFTLADARAEANRWKGLISQNIDPRNELDRERRLNGNRRTNTVAAVVEEFVADKLGSERKGAEVARDIRREFVGAWDDRPIADISRSDVVSLIKAVKDRGSPHQARNLLGYARRFFNWAIVQGCYGIEASPCDRLKPKDLVGKKTGRSRILNDTELRAAWEAAAGQKYPYGPLFQLLMLTGQRKSEIAHARRLELDPEAPLLLIPAERMKAGKAHAVPLSAPAVAIIRTLPEFEDGDYLFSTTAGTKPVNGFSKAKASLDKAMAKILGRTPEPFTIQDIRRTVRSGLSRLKVTEEAREAVIAHARPGIKGAYDWHDYLEEKREALNLWAGRVEELVAPPTGPDATNVIQLKASA